MEYRGPAVVYRQTAYEKEAPLQGRPLPVWGGRGPLSPVWRRAGPEWTEGPKEFPADGITRGRRFESAHKTVEVFDVPQTGCTESAPRFFVPRSNPFALFQ